MKDVYIDLAECIQNQRAGVFCLITKAMGSTPRKAGARMMVYPDGSISGTIGGGATEMAVIRKSIEIMQTDEPLVMQFSLTPANGQECGGSLEIYLEPVGKISRILIFGAGHVGQEVARLSRYYGFIPVLLDNRTGITAASKKDGIESHEGDYSILIDHIKPDARDYCVVCTHQHTFDIEVTARLANYPTAYLGMIGSKRKIATARDRFLNEFNLTNEQVNHINMPIGIPFAAETPEEIALSIIAVIVHIRNQKKGLK